MATEQLKYSLQYFKKLIGELVRENKNPSSNSGILPKLYQEVVTLKTSGSMSVLPCRMLREACEILASQINNQLDEKIPAITCNMASLIILNILTSSVDKRVYSEDVIDQVITYVHQQLFVCCRDSTENEEENRNNNKKIENMHLALNLLTELVFIHSLVDVQVTKISCIGVYAFGNGCHSLKICSIRLLCGVFSKYESHQFTILNDIQEYSVKCGSHDELTPSFPINTSSKNISSFCVLVMSLLQNTTVLPKELCGSSLKSSEEVDCLNMKNLESFIFKKHKNILVYSHHVTNEFLKAYTKQNGHLFKYYEAAFADFIHDLLSVLIEPDWPVSVILLSAIAKHLANILHNASASPTILTVCTRWLCEIMVKVNKTAQLSEKNNEKLDEILSKTHYKLIKCNSYPTDCAKENSRYQHLQSVFLKYVVGKAQTYHTVVSLDNFYIIIWYGQLISQESVTSKIINKKEKYILTENKENEPSAGTSARKFNNKKQKKEMLLIADTTALFVKSLLQFDDTSIVLCPLDVKTIISYFVNKAEIMNYFNVYLTHIINMLTFKQPVVRAKTMQCLKLFMDADMAFAEKPLFQYVMRTFIKDNCITVREISVDLIGRCMLHLPEKCEEFYPLLIPHLLDRGVSVRKQVFKILKDLTTLYPNFSKIPEVQSKLLERIEDPAMKHMVLEMFREKWFTPLNKTDKMIDQIKQLNEVMKISGTSGVHCLKVLFEELLGSKGTVKNCKQFVECFVHYLLDHEANNSTKDLCVCLQVLNKVAETDPDILVDYIPVLQSYLSLHQQENENIILSVIGILQHTVVLYQNPPEIFLTKLEEDLLKLIFVHRHSVVEKCVPCLTLIVKDITENHKLIFDCFSLFFGALKRFAEDKFSFSDQSISPESYIQRCLLITGLFLKHYDFSSSNAQELFEEEIIDDVFNTCIQILRKSNSSIQWYTLIALGEMCYHHSAYLLKNNLKVIYKNILTSKNTGERMKYQVLKNLEYFLEKESQMTEKHNKSGTSLENIASPLKQTLRLQNEDENSNMTIIIIQQYLEQITSCCVCQYHSIRCLSASILKLVVQHGLVPPQKIMAHVIALTTDNDSIICNEACSILKQVDHTYPGVFDFAMQVGINLSYGLQSILQQSQVIRGYIGTEVPSYALLTNVYKIVQRKKFRRRHFIRIILNQFTETEEDIDKLLYLSDNLAYLPYEFEDELLFIIQTINMIGATTGFHFLENFKEQLIPNESKCKLPKEGNPSDSNDDSDNENYETLEDLVNQLPKDTKNLQKCVLSFQQCRFLLKVKYYLQKAYGISNRMVILYSSEQDREPVELSFKNHCNFMTDSDMKLLIEMKSMKDISNEELIKQYLELKNLLLAENEVCSKNQTLNYRNFKQEMSRGVNKTRGSGRLQCKRRRIKNGLKDVDSDASLSD